MKKFGLPIVMLAAIALVSTIADSADAAVRRVYAAPRGRVHVVRPVRPIYRPRVVLTQPVGPVIYSPWSYHSTVIVPRANYLHVVPTARPIGVWSPVVW
jgi:hypothetical protein